MCNGLCAFVTVGLRARIHLAHAPQFCVERLKTRLASNKGGAWAVDHTEPPNILAAVWGRIQELTMDAHEPTETTRVAAFEEEAWKEDPARFVERWWKSSKAKAMRKEAGCAPVRGGGASKKKKRRGAALASTSGGGGGPLVGGQRPATVLPLGGAAAHQPTAMLADAGASSAAGAAGAPQTAAMAAA